MKRIDTASKAVDLFGAGKHGYQNGNLALGVPPTQLDASPLNHLQEEVARVIEAGGVALDGAVYTQLLSVLQSAGVLAGHLAKAATVSLAAAEAGRLITLNSVSAFTATLPAANAVPAGNGFRFLNINTGVATVQRAGADSIRVNNGTVNSLALGAGDTLTLVSDGVSSWQAVAGTAQLQYANTFAKSVVAQANGATGYQRLPSGVLLQWGYMSETGTPLPSGGTLIRTVTMPIAYTTFVGGAWANSSLNYVGCGVAPQSLTQLSLRFWDARNSGALNVDACWLAIGI